MELPTWVDCSWSVSKGYNISALSEFIYKYEPTDEDEKYEWRGILHDILMEGREEVLEKLTELLKGEKNG